MKLLLHACCGPCSIMPFEILKDAGHNITVAYMNSNIHPPEEYVKRGKTLRGWAETKNLDVVEGLYKPSAWQDSIDTVLKADDFRREDRCRACYRLRFEEAASYAKTQGFEGLSTTLTVSPYQFIEVIREELEAACNAHSLEPLFKDFRPFYPEASKQSRDLGMYRQNYCGCHYSDCEAAVEREERKRARKAEKEAKRKAREAEALRPASSPTKEQAKQ